MDDDAPALGGRDVGHAATSSLRQRLAITASVAQELRLECDLRQVDQFPAPRFEAKCVDAVRAAAQTLGYTYREIVSGAAHDAIYVARIAPAAMIFVPCKDGISHNEIEDARPEHLEAGANVLLHAILTRAAGSRVIPGSSGMDHG